MDVVGVVQGLALAPDDSEGGRHIGGPGGVGELHLVAVDGVAQQLGIHTCHTTLNVELAHKSEHHMVRNAAVWGVVNTMLNTWFV